VVRSGSDVVVTGTANDTLEFIAGASQNTVIVNGRSYLYPVGEVTAFRFDGGGGNDTAQLTASGIADLAETAQLHPGSATLQGMGYKVEVTNVPNIQVDGRGAGVQAELFDSAGNDSLLAQGDRASLSGDGFAETVLGFQGVRASATLGGHDTMSEGAVDYLLQTKGTWLGGP
jgi:hypothetical protein